MGFAALNPSYMLRADEVVGWAKAREARRAHADEP